MKFCAVLTLVALSCTVNLSFSQRGTCRPLNSEFTSCIAANFTKTIDSLTSDRDYVQNYSKVINNIMQKLDTCSPHTSTILCSLYVPKCVEGQLEPFLPCRRVCREFVYGCQKNLLKNGLSWLISLCHILPDEAAGSKCFEPEGFEPKHGNEPVIKSCDTSVGTISTCKKYKYKTFRNTSSQSEISATVSNRINKLLKNQENCSLKNILKELVCAKYAPPCLGQEGSVAPGALCWSRCDSLHDACPSALGPDENLDLFGYCAGTAEGHTKDGQFCQYYQWPTASYWPKGRWVKKLPFSFQDGLIAALVLVPILAVVGILVAVMIRRKMSRNGAGYQKQATTYDTGTDTVTLT